MPFMVRIRLLRIGKKNQPFYRIVVIHSRRAPQSHKYVDCLGWYNPRGKELKIDLGKFDEWLKKGAQPSDTVARLVKSKKEVQNERIS